MQPLMSKYITDALLTAAVNNSTAQGWRQEGRRWLKAAGDRGATRWGACIRWQSGSSGPVVGTG